MTEHRPNQIARIVAVVGLVTAFMLVAAVIATSGGDSGDGGDGGGGGGDQIVNEPTPQGERALEKGFYVVEEGDTLAQIAADTGLDQDQVIELNPQLDPQALQAGEKVRLR